MNRSQIIILVTEAIKTLRSQRKKPDRFNIAKLVVSKYEGLTEGVVIDTVEELLNDAAIYSKPNKRGDESLYVSKASAEAASIIETDGEEENE